MEDHKQLHICCMKAWNFVQFEKLIYRPKAVVPSPSLVDLYVRMHACDPQPASSSILIWEVPVLALS